jgi:hypothetical protein
MQKKNALWKKALGLAALSAFAAVPLVSSMSNAQADPPRHAPAWGYRDKNHNDYRNKRNDRRYDRNRFDQYTTATGTVLNVRGNSDVFELRVNGTTFLVDPSGRLPRKLNRGDVVRVYGRRVGNNILNASVVLIRNR